MGDSAHTMHIPKDSMTVTGTHLEYVYAVFVSPLYHVLMSCEVGGNEAEGGVVEGDDDSDTALVPKPGTAAANPGRDSIGVDHFYMRHRLCMHYDKETNLHHVSGLENSEWWAVSGGQWAVSGGQWAASGGQ